MLWSCLTPSTVFTHAAGLHVCTGSSATPWSNVDSTVHDTQLARLYHTTRLAGAGWPAWPRRGCGRVVSLLFVEVHANFVWC